MMDKLDLIYADIFHLSSPAEFTAAAQEHKVLIVPVLNIFNFYIPAPEVNVMSLFYTLLQFIIMYLGHFSHLVFVIYVSLRLNSLL